MCGLAGFIGAPARDGSAPDLDLNIVSRLGQALAHRGPDGQGSYVNGACAMVHTRLAIVDVEGGAQPFVATRADGSEVALIANGEIYNNLDLRRHLTGVDFHSDSDCEPALHLYLKYGLDFVDHLRGMYAIAIWDSRSECLILARDPFGIKPLYYVGEGTGFAFASEPGALVAAGLVEPRLNAHKRDEFLQLQFTTGRETCFADIKRLLPGETLAVEGGETVERRVRPALPEGGPRRISRPQAVEDLDRVLNDCVGVHQQADVPYGMFLSGGVDSSVLLAMMNRLNPDPVVAFTAGFSGTDVQDERALARHLAKAVHADHIEIEFGANDFWKALPQIAKHMDDAVADYAILPTWKLAEKARAEGLKVVLTGEGGDELFAGYSRYRAANRRVLARDIYRKGILDGLDVLRVEDLSRAWRASMAQAGLDAQTPGRNKLQIVQAQDIATWLPGDLLTKVDRMLMAHGIEGRVPFLDSHMADFAFTLPDGLKVKRRLGKRVLRRWLETAMPAAKPFAKKRGFTVPVGEWISDKGKIVGELVSMQACIGDICHGDGVRALFTSTHARAQKAAWTLLFYALWHKIHMEGCASDGDVFDVLST